MTDNMVTSPETCILDLLPPETMYLMTAACALGNQSQDHLSCHVLRYTPRLGFPCFRYFSPRCIQFTIHIQPTQPLAKL